MAKSCEKQVESLLDCTVEEGVESSYEGCSFPFGQNLGLLTELVDEALFIDLQVIFFGPIHVKDVQIVAGNLVKHGRRGLQGSKDDSQDQFIRVFLLIIGCACMLANTN